MTEQERNEGNKLIAEFMGAKPDIYKRWYYKHDGSTHPYFLGDEPSEFKYHKSFDWLMPVVEKIENTEWKESSFGRFCTEIESDHNKFEYRQHTVKINYHVTDEGWRSAGAGRAKTKIEATYQAVVDFIKWYNQNK